MKIILSICFFFQHYTVSYIEVQCCFTSSYCMQFTRWNAFTCQQWPLTDLKLENLLNWRYQIFFQVLIVTIIMNCCFMFDWQKRQMIVRTIASSSHQDEPLQAMSGNCTWITIAGLCNDFHFIFITWKCNM